MNFDQALACGGVFRLSEAPGASVLETLTKRAGATIRTLSASRATDKEKFLQLMAESLSLPDYFGANWDAFYDCLTDLAMPKPGQVWLIDGLDGLARNDPEEFAAAVSAFSDAADYWRDNAGPLTVLMVIKRAELAADVPPIDIA